MSENHPQALLAIPLAICAADIHGKLPAAAWPQAAQPGFPTDTADRSSDITEARAGARRDASSAVGIPEGGNSPAPSASASGEPAVSLPGAFAVDSVVMTMRQRAMVVALVSEYLRDTEDWLSVRDKNSLEALIDTLQGAAS